jgi:hypothetical protein
MSFVEQERVFVKSEGDFYGSLLVCPPNTLENTRGVSQEKKDNSIYLTLSSDILNPNSLFYRYLTFERSRQVFGIPNPLYQSSPIIYEGINPKKINYFNTKLLLSFMEVELQIGFSGKSRKNHEKIVKSILNGEKNSLPAGLVKYYDPFRHEDNIGLHYVQGPDGKGGYLEKDWKNFIKYAVSAINSAYAISPEDFAISPTELNKEIDSFVDTISTGYYQNGAILSRRIRRFGHLIHDVLYYKGSSDSKYVLNPATNEKMAFLPLNYCLSDMPFPKNIKVTFQSGCDDSF